MRTRQSLRVHQLKAIDWLVRKRFSGLFLDMGLGKTASVLAAFQELYERKATGPILVIAPLRVADTVWDEEALLWEFSKKLRVVKILGSERQRMHALHTKGDIYTINVDNVAWLAVNLYAMEQQGHKIPFNWLVVDESSMFKSRAAKRFRALRALLPAFERRTILTGTPTPNTMQELWPQLYILDQGRSLGYEPGTYLDRYFFKDFETGRYELKEGANDRIAEKIAPLVLRQDNKNMKDMPSVVVNEVRFKLPQKVRALYDRLEREMFIQVEDIQESYRRTGIVRAVNMAVLSGKCQQIANGAVFDSDERSTWHHIHDARLDVLEELLDELSGNALVAYSYSHDRDRILKRFPNAPVLGKQSGELLKEWNAGKHKMLLMHPKSGSHGLNMQFGGHDVIWFSNTFSGELHDQLIARLARPGQKNPFVTSHYLVAEDTVDVWMRTVIARKAAGQTEHLEALKSYQTRRGL
jgi:SNF2 family DNA or RNA helicase